MDKFTSYLLKVYENSLIRIITKDINNEPIENFIITDLTQYANGDIREDSNECYKYLDNFFEKIPLVEWENASNKILAEFDSLMRQEDTKIFNNDTKYLRTKKRNELKKDDIKALENALPVLKKFFSCRLGDGTEIQKMEDIPNDIEIPPSIYNGIVTIESTLELINNIKNSNLDQGFYIEQRGAKKEDLKNYLLELNKKYEAKRSKDIHKFINKFNPPQYMNVFNPDK